VKSLYSLRLLLTTALVLGTASAGYGAKADNTPTFSSDVAPIFHNRCVSCHRPGQIGPMSLRTYEEARPWAKSIAKNVKTRTMPPWHADAGYGPFTNDRSLTQDEIDTVVRWAKSGAPRGVGDFQSKESHWSDGEWILGEPDYTIEFDEVDVPGDGPDLFHDFATKLPFTEDKWITAVEILPGNRQVVHHVVLLLEGGEGVGIQQRMVGGWAAGNEPDIMPPRTGRLLPKGATLIANMHYHPNGTTQTDRTRVGLHFAQEGEIEKELVNSWIMNTEFEIPPGDPNVEAHSTYTFPQDSHIYALFPHMHYRGKDFTFTATYPDGRTEELLKVSRYDFNWQTTYKLEKPIAIPEGTRIDCVAHWDNSKNNPDNPDPTKTVRFGPESYDEMMIGFVDYTVDVGIRPRPTESPIIAKTAELASLYPGEVYVLEIKVLPSGGKQPSAFHVPRQGEGSWYVAFGSIVAPVRIYDIAWSGQGFEAKVMVPGRGVLELKGSTDAAAESLSLTTIGPNGKSGTYNGALAKALELQGLAFVPTD